MTISSTVCDATARELGLVGVRMTVTVKASKGVYTVVTSPQIQPWMLRVLHDALVNVSKPRLDGEVTIVYLQPDTVMPSGSRLPHDVIGQVSEALQPHVKTMLGELGDLFEHLTPIEELREMVVKQMCAALHQHLKNDAADPRLVSWHLRFVTPDRSGYAQVALKNALANAPVQIRDLYHASQQLDRQLRGLTLNQLELEIVGSDHPVFGDLSERITAVAIKRIVQDERERVMAQVQAEIMSRFQDS